MRTLETRGWCWHASGRTVRNQWRRCADAGYRSGAFDGPLPYSASHIDALVRSARGEAGRTRNAFPAWVETGRHTAIAPPHPSELAGILRTQGFGLALDHYTTVQWLGTVRNAQARYDLYFFVHARPAGHGSEALIVLANGRQYVGSYSIDASACRMRDAVVSCDVDGDPSNSTAGFRGGMLPNWVLIGPSPGHLMR